MRGWCARSERPVRTAVGVSRSNERAVAKRSGRRSGDGGEARSAEGEHAVYRAEVRPPGDWLLATSGAASARARAPTFYEWAEAIIEVSR